MWSVIGIAFCVLFFVCMLLVILDMVTDGVVGVFISEWVEYYLDKHRPKKDGR